MREWWNKLRGGARGIDDELAVHLEMEIERNIERGMSPEAARDAARRSFGNRSALAERTRESWGLPSLESILKDIRQGFRTMRRAPAFSLIVILTFALGVGINTAIFSVVHAVLLKPLPYPDAERLVWLGESTAKASGISVTWVNFQQWRANNHTFEDMAVFNRGERTLTGRGEPMVTQVVSVTSPYFNLLGMRPLKGRLLDASDDHPGAAPVAVLSHRFWSNQLGGNPTIVGSTVSLNGIAFEVAGVAEPIWEVWSADFYVALGRTAGSITDRRQHGSMRVLARLKPNITLAAAQADLDSIMQHLAETDPGPENDHRSAGKFLADYNTGDLRGTLLVLLGAATLILLIACANVSSLLLARSSARSGELAVRKAIGAGQLRLMRQLLTENIVIAIAGGSAGILFAWWGLRALLAIAPTGIPRLAETRLDSGVLLFACAITLAAGLLAGLAPVSVVRKISLATALKESARSAGVARGRQSFRTVLVVAEIALTFVLAFGAALLVRSLVAAQNVNPGVDSENVLMFSLQLPARAYATPEAIDHFYDRLLPELRTIAGVTAASAVSCPPGSVDCTDWFYSVPGKPQPPPSDVPIALMGSAQPGYFKTMRIPMRQGREFTEADRAAGPKIAIVNETLARRSFPHESAVGRQIKFGGPYRDGELLEIVGVSGDVRTYGLDTAHLPEIWRPAPQEHPSGMTIVMRTAGDPLALMPAVRTKVAELDRDLPLQRFGALNQMLDSGLARRRFSTLLLTLFAGLAMLLAGIGIYGLLSYWVSSREPEIAIRLALGASTSAILGWTSAHVLRLALAGVAFGAIGAWLSAQGLADLVFGIPARSPATFGLAAVTILTLAVVAAAIPARRASRVDAATRLHHS
jgi:putative ABC transport system permease protein